MRKYPAFVMMIMMLILSAQFGCSESGKHVTLSKMEAAPVEVQRIMSDDGNAFFETIGRVKNQRESTLASKVMGQVKSLKAKAGDKVKRGDLLVRIDGKDVAGQVQQASGALAQAKAAFSIAKTNYDRFLQLKESGSASQAELDKAKFDYQTAEGAVKQAKGALATASSYLAEAQLVAPFDGTVVDTMIEQGEMVAPGRPLVRIEGQGDLEFETVVNERDVGLLSVGQKVDLALDAKGESTTKLSGSISEIVPSSDGTHSNTVRIKLADSKDVRSGMFGRVRFPRPESKEPSIIIQTDRLVRHGQLAAVYIVDADDTLRLRLVREGRSFGDTLEILSGLQASDRLVISDIVSLKDGQPAKVVN